MVFGSFGDCASKSFLDCLQSFYLRRVDIEKEVTYSSRSLNELLRQLLFKQSCG